MQHDYDRTPHLPKSGQSKENPLTPHGLILLVVAGGASVTALLGWLINGTPNLFYVAGVALVAVVTGVRGLMLYLQPFAWPAGAPAGICGKRKKVDSLLRELPEDDSHLGTYNIPTGFWELIARALIPRFTYITPARRILLSTLGKGVAVSFLCVIIGIVLAVYGAHSAGLILVLGSTAVVWFGILVLYANVPDIPPGQPEVIRLDDLRLLEAGNPIGLLQNTVKLTSPHRGGDETRMRHDGPASLDLATYARFEADLSFESKPIREPAVPAAQTKSAELLEWGATAGALIGLAIFVLVNPASANQAKMNQATMSPFEYLLASNAPIKFCALVIPTLCAYMMYTAFCLRNTFRFRSDLVWIRFSGNYQYQKGGLNGARFAEVGLVKSDINAEIIGTRLLSECTLGSLPKDKASNVQAIHAARSALSSERYIVRTEVDEDFRSMLVTIADAIRRHRDVHRDVVGANLDSPEAQRITEANDRQYEQEIEFKHGLRVREIIAAEALKKFVNGATPVTFFCPSCKQQLTHSIPNQKVLCPKCHQKILVPTPQPVPTPGNKTVLGSLTLEPDPDE